MRTITESYVKEIKNYVECPELGFTHYGKWGALNREQRLLINDLCDSWLYKSELLDNYVKNWNELKKFVREELKEAEDDFAQEDFIKVLDRIEELEQGKDE